MSTRCPSQRCQSPSSDPCSTAAALPPNNDPPRDCSHGPLMRSPSLYVGGVVTPLLPVLAVSLGSSVLFLIPLGTVSRFLNLSSGLPTHFPSSLPTPVAVMARDTWILSHRRWSPTPSHPDIIGTSPSVPPIHVPVLAHLIPLSHHSLTFLGPVDPPPVSSCIHCSFSQPAASLLRPRGTLPLFLPPVVAGPLPSTLRRLLSLRPLTLHSITTLLILSLTPLG